MRITLSDVVDGAILAEYPGSSDLEANRAAVSAARALKARQKLPARGTRGLLDAIPGARTLLLLFDSDLLDRVSLSREVAMGAAGFPSAGEGRTVRIPVFYGGAAGADLPDLARGLGVEPSEFARRHAAARYTVAFVGFAPGFPYLVGLPPELHAPRLASPRTLVPAGSVAIGGEYTGIYPSGTPGGWRLIGRAPVRLFDPSASPPCLLLPGDRVAFEEVSEAEFSRLDSEREKGESETAREGDPLFRVLSPGLWTSVQGGPRFGWGSYGVPPGGAMDLEALAAGNITLENPPHAAALEITLAGPELVALSPAAISLSGAEISCEINGAPAVARDVHEIAPGDRLRSGHARSGARAYLCVRGGLETPVHPAPSRRLVAGDLVWSAERNEIAAEKAPSPAFADSYSEALAKEEATAGRPSPGGRGSGPLRVVLGPQDFSEEAIATFLQGTYRVSPASDRRGIRLEGPTISHRGSAEIPPEGTTLGAIQVPSGGLPIALGPDRPVTGGYAKIATVIGSDWARLAQVLPGSVVRFRAVEMAEAVAAREEGE